MKTNFNLFLSCLMFFSIHLNAQNIEYLSSNDFNLNISGISNADAAVPLANSSQLSIQSTIDPVLADSLQAALERAVDEWEPIGLSVAVNLGEGDVWAAASGMSSSTDTLTTDHLLGIGSVSKTMTSACILSMVDEGLLSLEDTIGTWISGYPQIDGNITVYQLLNHTSGIYNYTNYPNFFPTIFSTMDTLYSPIDVLDGFLGDPSFAPGEDWEYSNTNYLLLGLIIESISDKDYHLAVRERVLAPHGFDDIVLLPQESPTGPFSGVWIEPSEGQPPVNLWEFEPLTALFSSAWAPGAYAATPTDISEWARQLYSGAVLGDATDLLYNYNVNLGDDVEYSLGVFTIPIDAETTLIGHTGGIIYSSFVFYIPEKDVSVAIHTNDGTKAVDLDLIFLELYNECVEYELSTHNETVAPAVDFNIYPNPADNQLFVTFDAQAYQTIQINLYHTNGQLIKTLNRDASGAQQVRVDISDLASGVYFVELITETGTGTQNVIIR